MDKTPEDDEQKRINWNLLNSHKIAERVTESMEISSQSFYK